VNCDYVQKIVPAYPEEAWQCVDRGVMIDVELAGYVHYPPDGCAESITLVAQLTGHARN